MTDSDDLVTLVADVLVTGRPVLVHAMSGFVDAGAAVQQTVDHLLETLPHNQQEAVRLFYLEDRSYEAVAEQLGMPLGTVKTQMRSALQKLRKVLNPDECPGPTA